MSTPNTARHVAWHVILHMQHNGWWLHSVHDGKNTVNLARLSPHEARLRAVETIFSLDDASLRFLRPQPGDTETVVREVRLRMR